jgi:photosystem II stability/assembly factor-like uncharacterized protein
VLVSTNQGASWDVLHAGNCKAVAPDGHGKIYALCGDKLSASADGTTWTDTALPFAAAQLVIPEARPERVYVTSPDAPLATALHWTEDGGATWETVDAVAEASSSAAGPQALRGIGVHPGQPDLVIAATDAAAYVSEDGGKSFVETTSYRPETKWPKIPKGPRVQRASRVGFDATDGNVAYVRERSQVEATRDGGETWSVTAVARSETSAPLIVDALLPHPKVSGALYTLASDAFYVSKDFGATWAEIPVGRAPDAQTLFFSAWPAPVAAAEPYTSLQLQSVPIGGIPPLIVSPLTGRIFAGTAHGLLGCVGAP